MTQARIIDGKAFALNLRTRIAGQVAALKEAHGLEPGLAVVLVGDDPASQVYVRNKGRRRWPPACARSSTSCPTPSIRTTLVALVEQLNNDPAVDGILVQLPLPPQIDPAVVIAAIDPAKDVDGFHVENAGRLALGLPGLVPCTPLGCMMLLRDTSATCRGCGRWCSAAPTSSAGRWRACCWRPTAPSRSPIPARGTSPRNAAARRSWSPPSAGRRWCAATGSGRAPWSSMSASTAWRVRSRASRLVGDVAFAEAAEVAGAITPVPGGVGPMTIACLLHNTLTATCRQNGIPVPDETAA